MKKFIPDFVLRLSRLFSSVRAEEKRSDFCLKNSGSLDEAKSVKKNEIPQRGQFNIMESYSNRELPNKKSELSSSGAAARSYWEINAEYQSLNDKNGDRASELSIEAGKSFSNFCARKKEL